MTSPVRLRLVASVAFAALLATVPFEHSFSSLRLILAALAGLLLVVAGFRETSRAPGARVIFRTAMTSLLSVVLGFAICFALLRVNSSADDFGELAGEMMKRSVLFLLVTPLIAMRVVAQAPSPISRLLLLLPWVLGIWFLGASCYGVDPEESLSLFSKEAAVYVTGFYVLLNLVADSPVALRKWMNIAVGIFAVTSIGALVVLFMAQAGPEHWLDSFEKKEWIRIDFQSPGVDLVRAQFTFDSHNRLASYLLVGLLLIPLAWRSGGSRLEKSFLLLSGALISLGILFSGTRGAVLAAAVGLSVPLVTRPKALPIILSLAMLAYLVMPGPMRNQMATIFKPSTYTQQDGNVQLRMRAWDNTLEMIRDRPVFGFGYGWTLFEDLYAEYNRVGEDIEAKPHAHNNLLEVSAETGMVGGGIFSIWHLILGLTLVVGVFRTKARSEERTMLIAAFGLWLGLHFFGLSNYSLRRTVGVAVWIGWGFATVVALKMYGWALASKTGVQKN